MRLVASSIHSIGRAAAVKGRSPFVDYIVLNREPAHVIVKDENLVSSLAILSNHLVDKIK